MPQFTLPLDQSYPNPNLKKCLQNLFVESALYEFIRLFLGNEPLTLDPKKSKRFYEAGALYINPSDRVTNDPKFNNKTILYKQDGSPKLPPISGGINAITMQIALFSAILRKATGLISGLSSLLSNCLPEGQKNEVEQISATTQQYVDYGNDNYNNYDNSTYKGFVIKMEEVPFTPTVNRRRAVGYTTNGVPLIQTELSFSTNNQTLVTELKLIIDRDNLKAY
jgi:hypothetical protein